MVQRDLIAGGASPEAARLLIEKSTPTRVRSAAFWILLVFAPLLASTLAVMIAFHGVGDIADRPSQLRHMSAWIARGLIALAVGAAGVGIALTAGTLARRRRAGS